MSSQDFVFGVELEKANGVNADQRRSSLNDRNP